MKIFYSFLIVFVTCIMFLLPITGMIYEFRTDTQTDEVSISTAVAVTSSNVTLSHSLYANDWSTFSFSSNISESPSYVSYNSTAKTVEVGSLTSNATRTLSVTYDRDAFSQTGGKGVLLDNTPFLYYLLIICLPVLGIIVIFRS